MKGYHSITLHTLMALNLNGDKSRNWKYFNVSDYDTIIFQEILLLNPKLLSNIHKFIKWHPNINLMFPNKIILKVNKRLEEQSDRMLLCKLKDD